MSEPDFEKSFPIVGRNVSSASVEDGIPGWSVTLSIRTEIPAYGVIETSDPDANFGGSLIRLNPPESLVELAQQESDENETISLLDPTWHICVSSFAFTPLEKRNAIATDDGSCRSVFSVECINAIQARRNMDFSNHDTGCTLPSIPSECNYTGTAGVVPLSGRYSTWDGEDGQDINWLSGSQLLSVATDAWPRGDDQDDIIDRVTRYTDFVVISWVHNMSGSAESVVSHSLVCPKALSATDDGDGPGNSGDGDGGGIGEGEGNSAGNGDDDGDGGNSGVSLTASMTACVLGALLSIAF